MTSATDELRRLLDERGVEYVLDYGYGEEYPPEQRVTWSCDIAGEDMTITARDYYIGDGEYCLDLEFHEVFTPAQAIDATLGRGTCRNVDILRDFKDNEEFTCSECGYSNGYELGVPRYCPNCGRRVVE